MVSIERNVKVWILITLCSLLAWVIYWIPAAIFRFFNFDGTPWAVVLQTYGGMFMLMEVSAAVGMLVRFIGVFLGILALREFLPDTVWVRDKSFFEVKNLVGSALVLESIYFALLLPSGLFMIGIGRTITLRLNLLGIDYLLLVLFTAPFLAILAVKAFTSRDSPRGFRAWNWVAIAFVGYIASLWINAVVKSFYILIEEGFASIFTGIGALGAINSFVFMSLALVFAIVGAFWLVKQDFGSAFKWGGLALAMVGLHYLVYVVYSYLVGMLPFLMLAEIWAIPLLGLGLTMLRTKIGKMEPNS